jgi:aryl-alcohol dehydrogenase-like predicted oxidoreductase
MERRTFIQQSVIAAAALGGQAFGRFAWASADVRQARDRVTLGRSGLVVSRLAQGTGTSGFGGASDQTRQLGMRGLADLLRAGVDEGLSFWDLADSYGSHPHAREALRTVERESVVIMTKSRSRDAAGMNRDLERFRKELGVDQLDLVLLHCLTDPHWPRTAAGAMDTLAEAKQKGVVRAHGVSCHSLAALKAAAASPWVDVVLARINPTGAVMDAAPEVVVPVLAKMKAQGKGVIGMKILGAGRLRKRVDQALEYAVRSPVLDCFTIGAEDLNELRDLVRRIPIVSLRPRSTKHAG